MSATKKKRGPNPWLVVHGALLDQINQHGPIQKQHLGSAVKRVLSQLESANMFRKLIDSQKTESEEPK